MGTNWLNRPLLPKLWTPVHEAAHVPTPEADVDVPSPPQQAGVTTPPPDEAGREGARRGILVAPRPRWAQIGVAVPLAGMITTIPQLIWWLATGLGVFPLTPIRLWDSSSSYIVVRAVGGAPWPGRRPKGYAVLGSFAGLLDLVINWSILTLPAQLLAGCWYITRLDFLSTIGIAALFTAGRLLGDLTKRRLPRRTEEESEVVREIAQKASGPRRQPSESMLKLVQALGPSILPFLD